MLLCHRITNIPMNSHNRFNSKNSIKDEVAEETFNKSSQEQADLLMMNSISASLPQQTTNVMIPLQHDQVLTMLNQQGTTIGQQQQHPNLMNGFIMNKNSNAASVLNTIGGWNTCYHTGAGTSTSVEPRYTNSMRTIPPTSSRTDFDPNLLSLPKKRKHKSKELFPQKLMRVLSIEECQHAMRWMPDGCSFCIIDSQALVNFVLPKYFKEAKFSSFTRKLNRWGFKHFSLPPSEQSLSEREISIYCHDNFLRHIPSLCEQMNGGYRKSQEVGVILGSRNTQDGMQLALQQQQQHSMMMTLNQLRQIEQQRMTMLQQLMEQEQRMMIQSHQFQQGGSHPGALLVGQAGRVGGASMIGNSNMIGLNDNPSSLFGRNLDNFVNNSSTQGLNRISQGLMPNLPNRDMDFILGALSSTSNVAGKPFTTNNANNPGEKYQPNSQFFCNNSSPNTGSDSG